MLLYIGRRLLFGLVLALTVTFIVFWLLSFSIDSAMLSVLGSTASAEGAEALKASLGYDRPLLVQYFDWLAGIFTGDFGRSIYTGQTVAEGVLSRWSVTLSIVVVALFVTLVLSVTLGVWAASRGGMVDRIVQGATMFGYVFPSLLLAIVLVYVFAIELRWLPATGFTPIGEDPQAWMQSILIPVVVLTIASIATLAAQVRGSMIDELRKDYVRTLRSRGIPARTVVLKFALRGAAGPALTVLSLEFIAMFGGALIIERVFGLPGFGTYAFDAALRGDLPVILGATVYSVLLVVIVNLLADLANGWLNPKARVH